MLPSPGQPHCLQKLLHDRLPRRRPQHTKRPAPCQGRAVFEARLPNLLPMAALSPAVTNTGNNNRQQDCIPRDTASNSTGRQDRGSHSRLVAGSDRIRRGTHPHGSCHYGSCHHGTHPHGSHRYPIRHHGTRLRRRHGRQMQRAIVRRRSPALQWWRHAVAVSFPSPL